MRISTLAAPSTLLAALALAACGAPSPGLNAGAEAVQAGPDVPLASNPTRGQELAAVAANKVEISFDEGGTRISAADARQLDTAARLYRDVSPVRMFVAGHADGTGDEYANLLLSARRAQVVKQQLVARGIPSERLLLQAYGVSQPLARDDGSDANDRRVVVTWRIL